MASIERGRSRRRGDSGGSSDRNAAYSAVPTAVTHQGVARKQASCPGILSDLLFEAGNRQSRKASGVPMKMLIDEEMSKDVRVRHISPGAVGRLMGLDSLPTSGTHNQCHAPRASPGSFHDRHGLYQDIPHRRSADDINNVFEVMEASKTKMQRSPVSGSGNTSSRSDMIDDTDIDFIRQKFVAAMRLSTNESLHVPEELNETLDALVSNKDLLVEFLRKLNPVVRKDLHNHGSLSSTANCVTILKPSQRNQCTGTDKIYPQGKDTESYFNMKDVKHSLRKPYSNVSPQCLKEDSGSLRQKLSSSSHQENTDKCAGHTRIVVLKPCLEKNHDIEGPFALNHKVSHSDFGRRKECQDLGRWSPYTEEYSCQVSLEDHETIGHTRKGSREIAREITKQMRPARGGNRKHVLQPETRTSVSEKRSEFMPSVTKLKSSDAFHRSAELCDTWASSSFNSSPTYSTETSVSKEAKKHLSNRWKKANQYQHQITDNNGSSTLGDMLALSDQDASEIATHKIACQKCPKEEMQIDRMHSSCKDVAASNFTRSKSLPPSFSRGVQKSTNRRRTSTGRHNEFSMLKDVLKVGPPCSEYACRSRQRQSFSRGSTLHGDASDLMSPDNEERIVTEREIHLKYEEPADGIAMPDISEQSQHPAHLDHELDAVGFQDAISIVPEKKKESLSPAGQSHQMLKQPAIAFDDHLRVPNLDDLVTEDERREYQQADDYPATYNPKIESASFVGIDNHQVDGNQTLCIPPNESESSMSSKKDDQSPISVLESSMNVEDVYSGDFEKISADLQELRMQLGFLKRETTDSGEDTELFILSDDVTACQPPPDMKRSHAFRDEEERDFSYVLDILTDLGIHAANQDELLNNWYLLECSVGPDLYDKLENKYRSLVLWPQHERKLLFDITNNVLVDIITSLMQCVSKGLLRRWSPGWDQEEFAEMVWQKVVQLRQEMEFNQEWLSLDVEWVGSEDGGYLIGTDIGTALQEDLIDEIIADFLVMTVSAKLRG